MLKNALFPDVDIVQLDSLLKHSATVVLGNFFLGIANVAVFWPTLDQGWLKNWLMVSFVIMVLRILLAVFYKRVDKKLISNTRWHGWFVFASFLQGLCWMALSTYAVLNLEASEITVLIVTTAGLIGGSIGTASSSVQTFLSFAIPALFPISCIMLYSDNFTDKILGFLAIVYFILTVRAVFVINTIILDSIRNNKELQGSKKRAETLANELYKLSTLDALTQIANRRGFDETLQKEWQRALRKKSALALLMIDVDHFKKFNDHYGHPEGDECLKKVADILTKNALRSTDHVARYGGEEFTIILPESELDDAFTLAQKMCQAVLAEKIEHKTSKVSNFLTISIGVAHLNSTNPHSLADLIKMADRGLYEAKGKGRNCAVIGV